MRKQGSNRARRTNFFSPINRFSFDFPAFRADEKLHRRTTVRMGIRVVQRAVAPPSPYLFNPGVKSVPVKERQNKHKITLFGCKSAPLESKCVKESSSSSNNKSRSVEVGLEMNRLKKYDDRNGNGDDRSEVSPKTKARKVNDENDDEEEEQLAEERREQTKQQSNRLNDNDSELGLEIRTPTHVTFKDNETTENDEGPVDRVQSEPSNPTDNGDDKREVEGDPTTVKPIVDTACCENEVNYFLSFSFFNSQLLVRKIVKLRFVVNVSLLLE